MSSRRRQRTEGHNAALGRSRSPDVNYLQLLEVRTEKKDSIVSSSAIDEGLVGSNGMRPVGGDGKLDPREGWAENVIESSRRAF
jgi:hypothetical protein